MFGNLSNCVRCGVPGQSGKIVSPNDSPIVSPIVHQTIFPGICRHDGTLFRRQLWNQTCVQAQVTTNLACQKVARELLEANRISYSEYFQLRSVNESTILQRRMRALAVNDSDEKEFDFHYLEMDDNESSDDEYQDTNADVPAPSNQNAQAAEPEQQVNVVGIDAQAILEAHLQESGESHRGVHYEFEYEEDEQERRFL